MEDLFDKEELYRVMVAVSGLVRILEGDLSLLGSLIDVVHCEDMKSAVGSSFVMQSVKVNPSLGLQHRTNHISRVDFFELYALSFTD